MGDWKATTKREAQLLALIAKNSNLETPKKKADENKTLSGKCETRAEHLVNEHDDNNRMTDANERTGGSGEGPRGANTRDGTVMTRSGRVTRKPSTKHVRNRRRCSRLEPGVEYMSPISMMASSDPDTMYYHEILRLPDKRQFFNAMEREITDHNRKKHWKLVRRSKVPKGKRVLPSV
jgi:hypothetical protein